MPETYDSPRPLLGLNKPCEIEDFSDRELINAMREVVHVDERERDRWPAGREYRKNWEMGMVLLAMRRHLAEDRRRIALGVGAGTEATSFCLTNYFEWVFATDLYATAGWDMNSPLEMLRDPSRFAAGLTYRPRRLVTQHMDGRDLRYEDATFDFIYSCGSIEHFGQPRDIAQAAREIGRVLKPGGIAVIATEFCVEGPPGYLNQDTLLFSREDVLDLVISPSGCEPVDSPRFDISAETRRNRVQFSEALKDLPCIHRGLRSGWSRYPHILLEDGSRQWVSYQITLRKP